MKDNFQFCKKLFHDQQEKQRQRQEKIERLVRLLGWSRSWMTAPVMPCEYGTTVNPMDAVSSP